MGAASRSYSPQCFLAVGGGNVTHSKGSFPFDRPDGCSAQLVTYFKSGDYERDVERAIAPAMKVLGLPVAPGELKAQRAKRSNQLLVFDIDETSLSNIALHPSAGYTRRRLLGLESTPMVAPALKPTLELYKAACAAGHPIALITGRSEPERVKTMATMKAIGYGSQCAAGEKCGDPGVLCYAVLALRPPGNTDLASVYKPAKRAEIVKKYGYNMHAGFGDQFSDLNGTPQFTYAFKLPNPFYVIL